MKHKATIIDLSGQWQRPHTIDFERVAAAGVEGVILESNVGTSRMPYTEELAKKATDAGLLLAVYMYTIPKHDAEAQTAIALEVAEKIGALSIWNDAEDAGGLKPEALADVHSKIFEHLDVGPSPSGLYSAPGFITSSFGRHALRFRAKPLWLAQYGADVANVPPPWLRFAMWQHAGNTCAYEPATRRYLSGAPAIAAIAAGRARLIAEPGIVDGVSGEVDCSFAADGLTVEHALTGDRPDDDVDTSTHLGMQRALRSLGFEPGGLDGLWGPKSARALEAFRLAHGLNPSDLLNSDDAAALQAAYVAIDTPNESP